MLYPEEMKRARELADDGRKAKQIVNILERESPTFKTLSDSAKFRDVYRWIKEKENGSANWIEVHKSKHKGHLPLIPELVSKIVVNYSPGARVSKNIDLSIPSAQWWDGLLPTDKEQVLQTVDWLCKHKKDWWCKSREDYIDMIKRSIPGRKSDIIIIPKRKLT